MITTPRCFIVTAPLTYTERILEDGSGPTYRETAVLFVYSTDRARAIVLAVRAWRRRIARRRSEVPDAIRDGDNPFAGMKAAPYLADVQ